MFEPPIFDGALTLVAAMPIGAIDWYSWPLIAVAPFSVWAINAFMPLSASQQQPTSGRLLKWRIIAHRAI
jgi:hypothetical protein